jgi:hypothetical protein
VSSRLSFALANFKACLHTCRLLLSIAKLVFTNVGCSCQFQSLSSHLSAALVNCKACVHQCRLLLSIAKACLHTFRLLLLMCKACLHTCGLLLSIAKLVLKLEGCSCQLKMFVFMRFGCSCKFVFTLVCCSAQLQILCSHLLVAVVNCKACLHTCRLSLSMLWSL